MDETADVLARERALRTEGFARVAGTDEAGRGCLAGPVVAAAVILPEGHRIAGLDDSKKLPEKKRDRLRAQIEDEAAAFGVGQCAPAEIDELNILHAAMEAMRRAVRQLALSPDYVLVDGNRCPEALPAPAEALVKGDQRSHAIAAASVLAKTARDAAMHALHEEHPHYGWNTNVGYPTAAHYDALAEHGPTTHHRRSFRLERRS
jgi:ribonuclease HII